LLSSAVFIWVNKTENYKSNIERVNAELAKARKAQQDSAAAEMVAKTAHADAIKAFNTQIEAIQSDLKGRDQQISQRDVQIADLSSQVKQQLITLTSTGEALKASEAMKKLQSEQIASLRETGDKLLKQKADLDSALSDTTNKLDVMEREWTHMKEQLTESQGNNDRLMGQVKDLGGNPTVVVTGGLKAGAPAINGVVREVKTLDDNRQWATISVGSADSVAKGMEFKVIDRGSGSFLGILTVDRVEANEAIGVLAGPKITDIKPGNEVRTQL
jgi:chromosome segregation ATPase